jgi:hypothetical protein
VRFTPEIRDTIRIGPPLLHNLTIVERALPSDDVGVRAGCATVEKAIVDSINALDSTEKHLALLRRIQEHCVTYITAIALAHSGGLPVKPAG